MKEDKYRQNAEWIELAQKGEEKAMEALILNNAGLVNSIAAKFLGRGTEYEDLVQIGNIGLVKAIRSFDLGRECAFSTYAVPLIFGEIRRFFRDDGSVKVSRSQKRLGAMLVAEREKMLRETEGEVKISAFAARVGVSASEAAAALDAVSPVRSLSEVVWGEEDGPTLENTLADEEENERELDRIALAAAIDKLSELRKKIILLRYFRDYSQEKTARALGLTQVKVSREEKKILTFLREELS
jgi:RNA polymerase sporulation-specific sigma factor